MILEEDPEGILFPIFLLWLLLKKGNFFFPSLRNGFSCSMLRQLSAAVGLQSK